MEKHYKGEYKPYEKPGKSRGGIPMSTSGVKVPSFDHVAKELPSSDGGKVVTGPQDKMNKTFP